MKNLMSHSEKGFSLIEVMIGLGIMCAASIGFMNFMKGQHKSQKTIEMNAELMEIRLLIQQTITRKEACDATFLGMAPGDNLKEVRTSKDLSKPAFLITGERFRSYNVYVKSIRMLSRAEQTQPSRNITDAGIGTDGVGYAYLEVTFSRGAKELSGQQQSFYGGKDVKIVFPIRAVFAEHSLFAGCQKDATLPNKCKQKATTLGAADSYTNNFIMDETNPSEPKVFDITGCGSPGGYMLECNIYKDSFPVASCEV